MSFYITTPLYYVNDVPHIGSAYPTIVSDFIAGHMLQRGEDVCFLTGTDEHGQKIEKAAASNSKTPKAHCDFIAAEFQKLWKLLDIRYQKFVRTSSDEHKDFVTEFFKKVHANGDIYKAKYAGLYCVSCEDFKLEKDLEEIEGELCCPTHKQKVEEYEQENYFFALSKYQDRLKQYIDDNPGFIKPENRKNEVLGWIKEGLRDFPISRVGIDWGIELPDKDNHDKQKIYVWFDALLGYISGLGSDREKFWHQDAKITHIIGKDILRFHAVYWPAMLMSADYPLATQVFGHGFLTKDGMKMGKTLGNIIDPVALTEKYGSDAVRFFFARHIIFGKDGDFTEENFIEGLNADLANNLGNLLNRCLNLVKKNYDGQLTKADLDPDIENTFIKLRLNFERSMDELNPHQALQELFISLNKVNAYINNSAPWKIIKEGRKEEAINYLYSGLEACRQAAIYLAPLCPKLSFKIMQQLGIISSQSELNIHQNNKLFEECFSYENLNKSMPSVRIADELEPVFHRLSPIE